MIYHKDLQGSDAWLQARKGLITGSRFKDARDRLADKAEKPAKVDKKTGEILAPATPAQRGGPSSKMTAYAYDLARERCGGKALGAFVTGAMKFGTEQEPLARLAYEALSGYLVEEVGFITDDDGIFGLSPDGLIDDDGVLEIKTMVSSDTLFTAVADGDISAYVDQCNGYLWMLGRQWVDLVLWAPDLESIGLQMTVRRIYRDEAAIEALEADLLDFAGMVQKSEAKLKNAARANIDGSGAAARIQAEVEHKARIVAEEVASAERKRAAQEFIAKTDATATELKAAQPLLATQLLKFGSLTVTQAQFDKAFPVKPTARDVLAERLSFLSLADI